MNGKEEGQVDKLIEEAKTTFEEKMDNDLEISGALAAIFDLMHAVNKLGELSKDDAAKVKEFFCKIDGVLAICDHEKVEVPEEIQDVVNKREDARAKKDFQTADEIRMHIEKLGYILEDTEKGPRVKKK